VGNLRRSFILRGEDQARLLHAFLKANARQMAAAGKPLEVTVTEWKPRASDGQRALIWVINQHIADQAWVNGRRYEADVWHEQLKRDLLPEETRKGVPKWKLLANGDRMLHMSTEDLDREEKNEYITALLAYAADLGVEINLPAREPA
jgi:hypothetical protein